MIRLFALVTFILFVLSGCEDRSIVNLYDKTLADTEIPCLKLRVFPPDPEAGRTIEALYPFSAECPYTLELSTKAGIHCNATTNVPQKVTGNFPTAYLRLELRRGLRLLYSYYIDLTQPPDASDIRKGFKRLQSDVKLKKPSR